MALRTQQLIASESGVADVVDPLGGSWYVEKMTDQMEAEARTYIDKIDELGGIVRAIELGYPQHEIADSAFQFQRQVDSRERIIVGVNDFVEEDEPPIPTLTIHPEVEECQIERVKTLKSTRDAERASAAIEAVRQACRGEDNIVYPILEAVKAEVTLGEISDVFRDEFGVYRDPAYV